MKQVISKLTSILGYSRVAGVVGLLLAIGVAFGWAPFHDEPVLRALAAPGPEAEILTFIGERHPEFGLRVVVSTQDYVAALTNGDVDVASADTNVGFRERSDTTGVALARLGETITKPFGFYSSVSSAAHFVPGTTVVLPTERSAQSRALLLLYSSGYVTLTRDADTDLALDEVRGNPKELVFVALPEVERVAKLRAPGAVLVALDYDEAAKAGLQPARDARLMEDGFSPFANVLIVRQSDVTTPRVQALLSAYRESEVKSFILQSYNDSVRRPW